MSWKRTAVDAFVWGAGVVSPRAAAAPPQPRSILVLRNNDIGDLIVVTPLFEALRRRFPSARLAAGIGDWNRPVLANNPHVDVIAPVNAPWHNKAIQNQSPAAAARYIWQAAETRALRAARFDIGVDVLGSPWGALLMMRAGIPWRLGVRGYAGGHHGVQQAVDFDPGVHVGAAALRFATLLGAVNLPPNRPQLFLTPDEDAAADRLWQSFRLPAHTRRVVIAPGGGLPERCWPAERFAAVARRLAADQSLQMAVVGGRDDAVAGGSVAAAGSHVRNLVAATSLRELFALVARADLVICNSSMVMHVAAAFGKPAVVLLGEQHPPERDHAALWGGPTIVDVGRAGAGDDIASPERAFNAVSATLQRIGRASAPAFPA